MVCRTGSSSSTTTLMWWVIVPVKSLALAKSRLRPAAPGALPELALAMAADTVAVATACRVVRRVLVVTDDDAAAAELQALGAIVVKDAPRAGLNAALRHGADIVHARAPDCGVAALSADLPAATPTELEHALESASPYRRAFVSDASGVGTTLLTAGPGVPLEPAYGENSRERHRHGEAVDLVDSFGTGDVVRGLRLDVDTPADLAAACRLNVGPRTAAVLASLRS